MPDYVQWVTDRQRVTVTSIPGATPVTGAVIAYHPATVTVELDDGSGAMAVNTDQVTPATGSVDAAKQAVLEQVAAATPAKDWAGFLKNLRAAGYEVAPRPARTDAGPGPAGELTDPAAAEPRGAVGRPAPRRAPASTT